MRALAFLEVSHLLERAIEQPPRRDAGLSHAQYEILSRLGAADGGALAAPPPSPLVREHIRSCAGHADRVR